MDGSGKTADLKTFFVELRPQATGWQDIQAIGARSRAACRELRERGTPGRLLRTVFVPEDGTCFLLFAGAERDSVQRAVTVAGLALEGFVATWSSTDPGEVHP